MFISSIPTTVIITRPMTVTTVASVPTIIIDQTLPLAPLPIVPVTSFVTVRVGPSTTTFTVTQPIVSTVLGPTTFVTMFMTNSPNFATTLTVTQPIIFTTFIPGISNTIISNANLPNFNFPSVTVGSPSLPPITSIITVTVNASPSTFTVTQPITMTTTLTNTVVTLTVSATPTTITVSSPVSIRTVTLTTTTSVTNPFFTPPIGLLPPITPGLGDNCNCR
ncbi:hypothetical protein HMI56_006147 [Coelomomyces lativittatus]|nr:hypothetical protein HMI56_006147 [Coelomomyces lativittatus]